MSSKKQQEIYKRLSSVYLNPKDPGSLGGVGRLCKRAKELGITSDREVVKGFLETQRVYSYHKPVRKKFVRNKTVVSGIDAQWQADLADVQSVAEDNDNAHFILTVIDVFSKYAWAVVVTDKSAKTMVDAFKQLFAKSGDRRPKKLQTDKGNEFLNKSVQALLKNQYGIQHFTTMGDTKAALVERFNRTLKSRIWRFFTASNTKRFVDVLDDIVDSYNNSFHRTIKMNPADVSVKDEARIWRLLYGDGYSIQQKVNTAHFKSGDKVRIAKWKGDFAKGYEPNWTEEEFKLTDAVDSQRPKRVYKIEDTTGEPIIGKFYAEQLQKIEPGEDYIVERILNRRVNPNTKEKEILVKWEGWPEKFNCWISEANLNKKNE